VQGGTSYRHPQSRKAEKLREKAVPLTLDCRIRDNLRRTPFLSPTRLRKQWKARCTGYDDNGRLVGPPMWGVRYLPPYGWRHTCARNFLMVLRIEEVAMLLGSSVREIQNSYNHWIPAISREVADKKEQVIARLNSMNRERRS
jgi:integrase